MPYRQESKGAPLDIIAQRGAGDRPPPPAGVSAEPVAKAAQLYMPETFPIPGALEFQEFTHVASPGAGTQLVLPFQLPSSSLARIAVFTAGVDNMTNATRVTFALRVNRMAVPAWGAFQLFAGAAARATGSVDVYVRVPAGALIDVAVVNVDGAAYQLGVGYSGWLWSEADAARWLGQLYGRGL